MTRRPDPVPELYARAFDSVAEASGQLRGLRARMAEAEADERESSPLACGAAGAEEGAEAADEAPTEECVPREAKPPGNLVDAFDTLLSHLAAL